MTAKQLAASFLGGTSDTYLYALAANSDETVLATIGSDNSLRLFDSSLRILRTSNVFHQNGGITCLTATNQGFITAGRDGSFHVFDTRSEAPTCSVVDPQGRSISTITSHNDHCVAVGTESMKEGLGDVAVLVYDLRNQGLPLRAYTESHTDTITQVAFHPTQPNVLLSASTDGLVSFFDINQSDEDDALQQVLNPRSAVHCAGFLAHDQAYVLTTDEHFSVYHLEEQPDATRDCTVDFGDVREKLNCSYVVGLYQNSAGVPFLAHGHNENQALHIIELTGGLGAWEFGEAVDLKGAHGEEIVRDMLSTKDNTKAYTCGEDGQVRIWQWGLQGGDSMQLDSKQHKTRKDKKTKRYAPY